MEWPRAEYPFSSSSEPGHVSLWELGSGWEMLQVRNQKTSPVDMGEISLFICQGFRTVLFFHTAICLICIQAYYGSVLQSQQISEANQRNYRSGSLNNLKWVAGWKLASTFGQSYSTEQWEHQVIHTIFFFKKNREMPVVTVLERTRYR